MGKYESSIDMLRTFVVHLFKVRSKLGRGKVSVFDGHFLPGGDMMVGATLDEFVKSLVVTEPTRNGGNGRGAHTKSSG